MLFRVSISLLATCALVACGSHKSSPKKKVQDIFIHGDPLAIVAGTTPDTNSPFKTAEVDTWKDFNLYGGAYFHERSEVVHQTTSEEGNEASTGDDAPELDHFAFTVDGSTYRYTDPNSQSGLILNFTETAGVLNLTSAQLDGATDSPVEIMHYSANPAKDTFAVLFKTTDPDEGNGILGVWFTKNTAAAPLIIQDDTEYKFLLGPGIKAAWPGDVKIDVCGDMSDTDAADMTRGIQGWATAGKLGTHTLTVGRRAAHPPFTDVNSNCIKLVDDFYFEDESDYAVYGITLSAISKTTAAISSANIVISQKAFEKTPRITDDGKRSELLAYVVAHEFGHFIGLDHEFTTLPDGSPKYQSIMSYQFDNLDPKPRPHDQEAMTKLYAAP